MYRAQIQAMELRQDWCCDNRVSMQQMRLKVRVNNMQRKVY